jgi:hypothetical protein
MCGQMAVEIFGIVECICKACGGCAYKPRNQEGNMLIQGAFLPQAHRHNRLWPPFGL